MTADPVAPVTTTTTPAPLPSSPELGETGAALWLRIVGVFDFMPHELGVLEAACRQADDVAELERVIERDGFTVSGAAGQTRLNACVTEARQGRLALAKLLGSLALPDEDERPLTEAQKRARKAATTRWARRPPRPGSAA